MRAPGELAQRAGAPGHGGAWEPGRSGARVRKEGKKAGSRKAPGTGPLAPARAVAQEEERTPRMNGRRPGPGRAGSAQGGRAARRGARGVRRRPAGHSPAASSSTRPRFSQPPEAPHGARGSPGPGAGGGGRTGSPSAPAPLAERRRARRRRRRRLGVGRARDPDVQGNGEGGGGVPGSEGAADLSGRAHAPRDCCAR